MLLAKSKILFSAQKQNKNLKKFKINFLFHLKMKNTYKLYKAITYLIFFIKYKTKQNYAKI